MRAEFINEVMKKFTAVLFAILVLVSFSTGVSAKAKRYVKSVSIKKKATITIPSDGKSVTKTYKVTIKVKGKVSAKFIVKSSNTKIASVKASGRKVKVNVKKAGKVKIKITTKAKGIKGKKLSKTLLLTVKKAKLSKNTVHIGEVNESGIY